MIGINPSETRNVSILHPDWDMKWTIQLPEAVTSMNGRVMTWPSVYPDWVQTGENAWSYEWRTTPEYIAERMAHPTKDNAGNTIRPNYVIGLALKAEIKALEDGIALALTMTNESTGAFYDVRSEGGCFRAESPAFQDQDEVKRSYLMVDGAPKSMADLHRTIPIRSIYHADLSDYEKDWVNTTEWFWGRSDATIDCPVIVGAVSADGLRALAFGYEGSTSGSQNADGRHCLHSQPVFGDMPPGASVTRRGYIRFGSEIGEAMNNVKSKLAGLAGAC
ncbi:MAG: hypothetical protein J7M08_00685 [Planctomycetes bacterium]|nr:hypothetical protein [Planctomycetota bacterium]